MGRFRNAARKEKLFRFQMCCGDPVGERVPRLLGDLKLDRPLGFLLHDDRARRAPTVLDNFMDAEPNQIAPAQLAVDGEVE